jgi:formylglycine-generating enzyme required for sulfatase activity
VTQDTWRRVTGTNPSRFKSPDRPVEQVSWTDCRDFLRKLNAMVDEPLTFRLPTEAEWEWACRAGTVTPFYLGNSITPKDARYDAKYHYTSGGGRDPQMRGTVSVGSFPPNPWGLHDMMGNVYEWCTDWYDEHYYPDSPETDPKGPARGTTRVMRGGAWNYYPNHSCASFYRNSRPPAERHHSIGLRVAADLHRTPDE